MATTQLDICNRAIQKIGGLKLADLAGTDVYTVAVNRAYTDALEFELRAHNWNFAIRRTSLSAPYVTITGITAANPPVVTYTGTDPANGDRVYIESVVGMTEVNNHYYAVADVNTGANTFELQDPDLLTDIDGSAYTAWSSGGTAKVVPPFGWNRKFALPSNCIRVVEIDGYQGVRAIAGDVGYGSDFTIENGFILCNDDGPIFIRYITSDTTNYIPVSAWDSMFKEVMACRIALEISTEVKQNDANWQKLKNEYAYAISQAKAGDSIETPSEIKQEDDWILARL
jgi:hypothetical protein